MNNRMIYKIHNCVKRFLGVTDVPIEFNQHSGIKLLVLNVYKSILKKSVTDSMYYELISELDNLIDIKQETKNKSNIISIGSNCDNVIIENVSQNTDYATDYSIPVIYSHDSCSHAEGVNTIVSGGCSHAEGVNTIVTKPKINLYK